MNDFETVAWISTYQRYFPQTTSFVTFQCRSCQRRGIWTCPLWNTEKAAGSDVPACGATCSQ